ncbi:hypothetical protein ACJMK2_044345 [Sinanodonta woodiana]|uniref:DZIP3-like HEPN domain-containing protein n=1 Tax=Sinanodonta woodiana TaxID=1069815 RepID=A0ABD3W3E4_SINWO
MATQSLPPEMTSYARLLFAIKDVCTKCLRDVLLHNVPGQDIKQAIIGHQCNSTMLKQKPFTMLFQNNQLDPNFSVSDCEISLLYSLIRNVSSVQPPSLGWGPSYLNNPQDTSVGANVERLHHVRNTVIHLRDPSVSRQDFDSYWTIIRDCLTALDTHLGGTTYQDRLDSLETVDLDPDQVRQLIQDNHNILQDLQAGQRAQDQTLSVIREEQYQRFSEVNDKLAPIAEDVKVVRELWEGKAKENGRTQPQLNSDQGVRTVNTTSNQDINGGDEIGDLASGMDGKLCITKQYAFIKVNLTRESGLAIAKCLLDQSLLCQDAYDRMGNTCCARRHPIDILLKKVIHGSTEEIIEAFFKRLKVECPLIARAVKETTITEMDRLRFSQIEACGIETGGPFGILRPGISERDVNFFKYHLCESEEVIEHITDVMLSRFHFSILDHSNIIDCPRAVDMISALFKAMQFYELDVAAELCDVVKPELYQKWMASRSTQGSWLDGLYQWIKRSMPEIRSFQSEEIELTDVERGSIILIFSTGENFSVDLLKPESLKMKIKTLLTRGCFESKTELKSVALISVYIESPPNKGLEEIHIYIDFPATDASIEADDHQAELRIRNRDIMLEEMNPARLKQWIFDQPCIENTHRDMLESKLSGKVLLRQEEMTVLLDFINEHENSDHLLEKYCETNERYVYNTIYQKHQKSHSQPEEIPGHKAAVTYVEGGGLQELFSFSIIFNDEGINK